LLPERGWSSYEAALRRIGENRPTSSDTGLIRFLTDLGLVETSATSLTPTGREYFLTAFILKDGEAAKLVLQQLLLAYPPAAAIAQLLWGVADADRATVELVLRSQNFGAGLTDRMVGSLLMLLKTAEVIEYSRTTGALRVLVAPLTKRPAPTGVFVSPQTPYGNKVWLRRILEECDESILWLDKHFMATALESLWEAADASRLKYVKILSLRLPDHEASRPLRQYRDLVREMSGRGIKVEWRTIDSGAIKDTHDRWISGGSTAWNVPNVNAIYSGQHSEMHATSNRGALARLFDGYWSLSVPFDPAQV
jgi:hypothetical protein